VIPGGSISSNDLSRTIGKNAIIKSAILKNSIVSDGAIQTHLAQRDVLAGFKTGHMVNPLVRGHTAYRTDDLAAFKAHLDAQGARYSDWGNTAVAGWHQIFFYDPDGNVIEVHQVDEAV